MFDMLNTYSDHNWDDSVYENAVKWHMLHLSSYCITLSFRSVSYVQTCIFTTLPLAPSWFKQNNSVRVLPARVFSFRGVESWPL